MTQRKRGKNGAARRYKGPRELVGARVSPRLIQETDDARDLVGATRNDWIAAALIVALARPEDMKTALQRVEPRHSRVNFDGFQQEVLDRSA